MANQEPQLAAALFASPQSIVSTARQLPPASTCPSPEAAVSSTPDRRSWKFWRRMGEIFGHKWASQYGERPTPLWCGMLAQLTDDQVRAGIALLVESGDEWPPGLPEFRKLCVEGPVAYGLPTADAAWDEAVQIARRWKRPHETSHQVVWHALSQIGNFSVLDEQSLEKRFRQNYTAAVSALAAGKGLQPIPQPLPPPEKATPSNRSPEEQARFLAEIDQKLAAAGIRVRGAA